MVDLAALSKWGTKMKFNEFWETLKKRNLSFAKGDEKITITVDHFHIALRQAYDQGESEGEQKKGDSSLFDDIFGKGFGR